MRQATSVKLLIWLFFTFFAPVVLSSSLAYWYEKGERHQELVHDLRQTGQAFGKCLSESLAYFFPQEGLKVAQMTALSNQNIVEISAYSEIYQTSLVHIDMPERKQGEFLSYEQPVYFDGKRVGIIRISITMSAVGQEIFSPLLKKILIIFLVMSLIGFLAMGFVFQKYMTLPMKRLLLQAQVISKGALERSFTWQGNNEFAILGKTIDTMRKKLFHQFSKVHLEARTDQLTGISNRRDFLEKVKDALGQCCQENNPFSLIMFDLDDFKQVNDTYGHAVGDEVLHIVSLALTKNLRTNDLFARWGGEEFLLALCCTPGEQAAQLAEKLRQVVCEAPYPQGMTVTASFGVAQSQGTATFWELLEMVDKAMYLAKKRGKNCVVVYEGDSLMKRLRRDQKSKPL